MSYEPLPETLKIESIFHPSDFSGAGEMSALEPARGIVARMKLSRMSKRTCYETRS